MESQSRQANYLISYAQLITTRCICDFSMNLETWNTRTAFSGFRGHHMVPGQTSKRLCRWFQSAIGICSNASSRIAQLPNAAWSSLLPAPPAAAMLFPTSQWLGATAPVLTS